MSLSTQDANYHRVIMATTSSSPPPPSTIGVAGVGAHRHHPNNQNANAVNINNKINNIGPMVAQDDQPASHNNQQQCSLSSSMTSPSQSKHQSVQQTSRISNTNANNHSNRTSKYLYDQSSINHFRPVTEKDPVTEHSKKEDEQVNSTNNSNNNNNNTPSAPNHHGKKTVVILENSNNKEHTNQHSNLHQKKSSSSSLSSAVSGISSSSASRMDGPLNSSMDEESTICPRPITRTGSEGMKPLNRRGWYHLWLPSYKSRLNQFQKQFTDKISSREKLIDDFVCAIQRELLLQGRMYVSLNYISFYSNIFGYETSISISYQDIHSITKASTVKLFPNAIQIVTKSGLKYFFTSFVSRERAFRLITRLWQLAHREQPMPWPEIRKLIRESYTTNSLGIDLSDIDDANTEIDLSKKANKKKKHAKRKSDQILQTNGHHYIANCSASSANMNSSSELTPMEEDCGCDFDDNEDDDDDYEEEEEEEEANKRHSGHHHHHHGHRHLHRPKSRRTHHNADVQTDDCRSGDSDDCSIRDLCKLLFIGLSRKIQRRLPNQSQVIRVLFVLAIILFLVQLAIYSHFHSINQRLSHTQQILLQQMILQQQDQQPLVVNLTSHNSDAAAAANEYCLSGYGSGSC